MTNNLFIILKAVLSVLFSGLKNTWRSVKKATLYAANAIRSYVTANNAERELLMASHKSDAKTATISIALVAGVAIAVSGISSFIGSYFMFIPAVIRHAVGYLVIMLGTEMIVVSMGRIGVRMDIIGKALVTFKFVKDAFVPYMVLKVICNMTVENAWALISCYIAVGVYAVIKNPPVISNTEETAEEAA